MQRLISFLITVISIDAGEKYGQKSHDTLSGFKTLTLINAQESVTLINDSTISTSNGDLQINARNININNSEIVSRQRVAG